MAYEIYQSLNSDVAIIGGGLAAMKAAFDCAKAGLSVTMVIKSKLCSGSSFYPLTSGLGCQAPKDDADRQVFFDELIDSGAGMAGEELTRIYIDEIWDAVRELPEMGIDYNVVPGRKACFAKSERSLCSWYDLRKVSAKSGPVIRGLHGVKVLEYTDALALIKKSGRVVGLVAADLEDRLYCIGARHVMMMTGGYCSLYRHSLNTADVNGTGQIMALEAGAKLINLEFIQFIPGMLNPVYKLLFSELSLAFCDAVLNADGKDILTPALPSGLSARECLDMRSGHGPFTCRDDSKYFDIAIMDYMQDAGDDRGCRLMYSPGIYKTDNYYVNEYNDFCTSKGVDLCRDEIFVAPFGHAANGGILIDGDAFTGVPGLLAAGEVTGGLNGADRHGGLASGMCLVFGRRAAMTAARERADAYDKPTADDALAVVERLTGAGGAGGVSPEEAVVEVRKNLYRYAGVVRHEDGLKKALAAIGSVGGIYDTGRTALAGDTLSQAVTASRAISMGRMLCEVMLHRRESRGAHYRRDFPNQDDKGFGRPLTLTGADGGTDIRPFWGA